MAQWLGHEAAQRGDRLLDGRPGDQPRRGVGRQPGAQLAPHALVGPVVHAVGDRALHVVAAQHRVPHRRQREAPLVLAVDQLVAHRRRAGQDAQPPERVQPLERPQRPGREGRAADAVGTVATGHPVGVDALCAAVAHARDRRVVGVDVVERHVVGLVEDQPASLVARCEQVLLHLGLAVHRDAAARERLQVDAEPASSSRQRQAPVHVRLAVEALAHAGRPQHLDGAVLEDPGPDATGDVGAAAPFDHDARDAAPVEQLRQQQARRAGSHDGHLRAHVRHSGRSHRRGYHAAR